MGIEALHIRFSSFSASFRHLLFLTGVQISTPVPPFSTLLGIVSACAGRIVTPRDTRLGFEFSAKSTDRELERTNRFQSDGGVLREHRDGQSIMLRQVYFDTILDLYVTNTSLKHAFESPVSTPSLGRSQDLAWIDFVREIDLESIGEGDLGATLVPQEFPINGLILRLPEWMENDRVGYVRRTGPFGFYTAGVPTDSSRIHTKGPNLFHPSDSSSSNDAVYIHTWSNQRAQNSLSETR